MRVALACLACQNVRNRSGFACGSGVSELSVVYLGGLGTGPREIAQPSDS